MHFDVSQKSWVAMVIDHTLGLKSPAFVVFGMTQPLGCPSLWAFIDTSYPIERIKMLLGRSGQVPLIVKPISTLALSFGFNDVIDQSVLTLVLQEVPRIMKLEVMITESISTKLAMVQYPSLRSLCLRNGIVDAEIDTDHEKKNLPLNLDIPHLRSLKVFLFKFSEARALLRPWLQKLILKPTSYPSLREVSECIRELPFLSSLDLPAFDNLDDDDTTVAIQRPAKLSL